MKTNMRKFTIIMIMLMTLYLSGCQNNNTASEPSFETKQDISNESISESAANKEYDSIEDFLSDNSESVFAMNPQKTGRSATSSNAAEFKAVDNRVSVAESYIAVTYECEAGDDMFQLKLATYTSNNGKEQLASVVNSNPGIFTEKEIGGICMYYCPGSDYDWFNCYAMVINRRMFVINIEKGYDDYMETILNNIILQ